MNRIPGHLPFSFTFGSPSSSPLKWRPFARFLVALAICAGVLTFGVLESLPLLTSGRDFPAVAVLGKLMVILVLSAPVVLILSVVGGVTALPLLKLHAILFTLATPLIMSGDEGHSSPGLAFADAIELVVVLTLFIEISSLMFLDIRAEREQGRTLPWYCGTVGACLVGWFVGYTLWAAALPRKVITSAQVLAAGEAFCIEADGQPAGGMFDLSGFVMKNREDSGYHWRFHGLLVISDGPGRRYANWSYRQGRFIEISARARESLRLDKERRCAPSISPWPMTKS